MESGKIVPQGNFVKQNITFNGLEKQYSFEIVAEEVTVHCSLGSHNHGSSKVQLTNVVDYNWELQLYSGQLLAVHLNGKVIAYGIKGKSGGMIRITNLETNQRALIKEMTGLVQDIAFALIPQQIVLACVDAEGSLYIYNIIDRVDSLECTLLMNVLHQNAEATNFRVIWCPYLPSYDEDADTLDDPAKLLALLNGNKVEIWDVSIINSCYGTGPLQPHEGYEGYIEIDCHAMDVVDASFAPDGTALATASLDGLVRFFQVYMPENEKPRCLHEWNPHGGAALSSLLFLDNVHTHGPESRFWKFAITGSKHNSELKIWSLESWTCLQTLHFLPNPNSLIPQLYFKVRLDMTAQYFLMSDIENRILYVLHIEKNDSKRVATVSSISEFLLSAPILSYCITNADIGKLQYSDSTEDLCMEENEDESNIAAIVIKMYVVQPKRLQECTITFQTENLLTLNGGTDFASSELVNLNDKTEDKLETEIENKEISNLKSLSSVTYLLPQQTVQPTLTLMTPDAFNSPPVHSSPNNKRNSITSPVSLHKSDQLTDDVKVESLIDAEDIEPLKETFTSANSSPSREVEEILSFKTKDELIDMFKKIDNDIDSNLQVPKIHQIENLKFNEISNETVWPNIPLPQATNISKEENRILATIDNDGIEKSNVAQINLRLNTLETVVREQNNQLQKLQQEIKVLSKGFNDNFHDGLKGLFVVELEKAFTRNQVQQTKVMENFINIQKNIDDERNENIVSATTSLIMKQITEKLELIISHEIKTIVLPSVITIFEALKHQLALEYSQKLNTTDHLLRDNISKLITSRVITDSLSSSVVNVIKPSLEECYRDMVKTTLIPSWERVCGIMFQQINDTFTKGTKEYTASVESYMDRQRHVQDKGKDLIIQMQTISDTIKTNADKLTNGISHDIEQQYAKTFLNMQEQLTRSIGNLVTDSLKQGFKNHASIFEDSVINAVRSRAVTPAPHIIDTQVHLAQIHHLLSKGQIDAAFQQALSASDLSLVVHVCKKLNPHDVFPPGHCKLPQPVLLSLIQQLSADLGHNTELKHRYLEEAVLNLEPSNAITREHMPVVLTELLQQLTNFISAHPTNKNCKNLRLLRMAVQSLL